MDVSVLSDQQRMLPQGVMDDSGGWYICARETETVRQIERDIVKGFPAISVTCRRS